MFFLVDVNNFGKILLINVEVLVRVKERREMKKLEVVIYIIS